MRNTIPVTDPSLAARLNREEGRIQFDTYLYCPISRCNACSSVFDAVIKNATKVNPNWSSLGIYSDGSIVMVEEDGTSQLIPIN